ncbi:glycosyltransferase family 2 protein [Arthrobacter sp. CAN_A1]|uniref:glycosyltransferase family 2 protein n=1 Tax=Arthrobacter sp. CAN_A1 TaxID=2787717 RepID=UPI0018CB5EC3
MNYIADSLIIAVLTYRRPEDLQSAIPALLDQVGKSPLPTHILVIDNDPDGGAASTVSGFDDPRLRYVHEPTPGIAAARNRALTESRDTALLVFIDDDEVPSENWLASLLETYRTSGAAAVVGPVISEYARVPDPWVAAGEFFKRRRLPTGTPLTVAATNNLLLDLDQIRALELRFDDRFGLSGGSDTLFTRHIATSGRKMVWCDEAVVVDRVPEGRLTREWVLRRAFRSGNGWSRVTLELSGSIGDRVLNRAKLLGAGGIRLLGGLGRFGAGVIVRSQRHQSKGLRTAARGAGMASGSFGYVYSEYKRNSQI